MWPLLGSSNAVLPAGNCGFIRGTLLIFVTYSSISAPVITNAQSADCHEKDFSECLKSFDTIISHRNLGFAATEAELNSACRYLRDGVNCIDRFVKRCSKARADALSASVKGAFDILELLCEDTYHRNQYLQHAECYRRIATQIEECMFPMRNMGLRSQSSTKEGNNKGNHDTMVCCAYHNATECIHRVSSKECNDRAATFLKNYTDRAAYPITQQCRNFDNKVCTKSSASKAKVFPSVPLTVMMIFSSAAFYAVR